MECSTKGFTTFELIVVIALLALLASVALPKFYHLSLRAEALSVQGTIGTMRSALSYKMAHALARGVNMENGAVDGANPIYPMRDLLNEYPHEYLGVLTASDRRGVWYDDKNTHELVYVMRNDKIVSGITGKPKKIRWGIVTIYAEPNSHAVETLHATSPLGLILQPSTLHKWVYE